MEKLQNGYYKDAYITSFLAEVVSCTKENNEYSIILNQTYFYPEGGGQPSDIGTIGDAKVLDVREVSHKRAIIHKVDKPLTVGESYECSLDWDYRFSLMQNHTGEHIVSGIINKLFGYDNVGFHMGTDFITLDINGELTDNDLIKIEYLANQAVFKNIPVNIAFHIGEELEKINYRSKKLLLGEVRIVTIPEYDICACCGLHLRTTGEIGIIKIITAHKYKSGMRIYMLCGNRALEDYSNKNKTIYSLSNLLSAKPNEVQNSVEQLQRDNLNLKQKFVDYKISQFNKKIKEIHEGTKIVCLFEEELTPMDLRHFCLALAEKAELVAVFSGADVNYQYAIGSKTIDVREIGKIMNQKFNGKGGGKKEIIQGSIFGNAEQIKEFILSLMD